MKALNIYIPKKMVHCDIKSDNVLVVTVFQGNLQPKIIDFNKAKYCNECKRRVVLCMSPVHLQGSGFELSMLA